MTSTVTEQGARKAKKVIPHSISDYSERSTIRQAYSLNQLPIAHRRFMDAVKQTLGEGVSQGEIRLKDVLRAGNFCVNSGRQILTHLQNFGIIRYEPITADLKIEILRDPATMNVEPAAAGVATNSTAQDENSAEEDRYEAPIEVPDNDNFESDERDEI